MEIKEGYIDYLNYKTFYRIVNPKGKKTPLLMLHGGPGSTHNSFELFDEMAILDD
jgi:proline iminopeptidase